MRCFNLDAYLPLTHLRAAFVFAVTAAIVLPGCGAASVAAPAPPAHPERSIVRLLSVDVPLVVRPRDLRADTAVRRALIAAGIVTNGKFSKAALAQSVPCDAYDPIERGSRCFTVARREFVAVVGRRDRSQGLDRTGAFVYLVTFRSSPSTSLGEKLAASGALTCADAEANVVPWHGRATIAHGSYQVPFAVRGESYRERPVLIAQCPVNPELGAGQLAF